MKIYGYTKVCSKPGMNGKKSRTKLFISDAERDCSMYKAYSEAFDSVAVADNTNNNVLVDAGGWTKMSEVAFFKRICSSKDANNDVFGVIHASDCFIQFERFCQDI